MWRFVIMLSIMWLGLVSLATAQDYAQAYVPGDESATIQVMPLDDPGNPYCGQYSALDRLVFHNYSPYINDSNYPTIQLVNTNIDRAFSEGGQSQRIEFFRAVVELDAKGEHGYLVPTLVEARPTTDAGGPRTLGQSFLKGYAPLAEPDTRPYFWSVGLRDEAAWGDYMHAVRVMFAPGFPPVADWMVAVGHACDMYNFLPDGGVVVATPEVQNDLRKRQAQLVRYDAAGKQSAEATGDYMSWEQYFLPRVSLGPDNPYMRYKEHRDASGRLSGTSNNICCTGRYKTYVNEARDGFLAVVDSWQGKLLTPADGDLAALIVDPYPYFNYVDYTEVVQVHDAQQAPAAAQ